MSHATDLEARRRLLVTQCELDRLEIALAWHDLRRIVRPPRGADAPSHPWLGRALGFVIPLLGVARAKRFSRYLSLALLAYRAASGMRRSHPAS